MSIIPILIIAAVVSWLMSLAARPTSANQKSAVLVDAPKLAGRFGGALPPSHENATVPRGIACFQGIEQISENLITVLHRPPNVGLNNLIIESLAHTVVNIFMQILPRHSLQEHYRAHYDVQLSYVLLPGRRRLYKFDILPVQYRGEVSGILETLFERLPVLPIIGGPLFFACRFRINRHSSGSPEFPNPFAGLIDPDLSVSWETQLEPILPLPSIETEQPAVSLEECQRMLALAPHNAHAHWLLGAIYQMRGDFDFALEAYSKLLPLDGWQMARLPRAEIMLNTGRQTAAVQELDAFLERQPDSVAGLLLRGRALAAAGKLESAYADLTRVLELDSESGPARLHRAQVSFELNRLDDASADVALAISNSTSLAECHFLCGMIALRQSNVDEALQAFDQALADDPVHQLALSQRGQLYLSQNNAAAALGDFEVLIQNYPTSADAWALHGEARRLRGDCDLAMADFAESLARDANYMAARFGRARVFCDQNQPRRALGELHPVIECHPDWPAPRWMRATLLLLRGDAEPAIADLRYLRLYAGAVPLQTQMLEAQALLACNRPEEAVAVCEQIIHDAPDFWLAWIWHGQARVALGGPECGDESFDKAVEQQPEQGIFITAQQGLTAVNYHQRREDYDAAIRRATELLEEYGDGFPPRHLRANAYWYSQQLVEAIEDFSTILRDHPELTFARSGRGQVLAELGDADAALLDLNPAIEEFENSASDAQLAYALSGRALAWIALEHWDEAQNDLDRSLLLAPLNAWSMYHRGLWYHAQGQGQSANICFRLALVLDGPALPPHKRAKARAYVS